MLFISFLMALHYFISIILSFPFKKFMFVVIKEKNSLINKIHIIEKINVSFSIFYNNYLIFIKQKSIELKVYL